MLATMILAFCGLCQMWGSPALSSSCRRPGGRSRPGWRRRRCPGTRRDEIVSSSQFSRPTPFFTTTSASRDGLEVGGRGLVVVRVDVRLEDLGDRRPCRRRRCGRSRRPAWWWRPPSAGRRPSSRPRPGRKRPRGSLSGVGLPAGRGQQRDHPTPAARPRRDGNTEDCLLSEYGCQDSIGSFIRMKMIVKLVIILWTCVDGQQPATVTSSPRPVDAERAHVSDPASAAGGGRRTTGSGRWAAGGGRLFLRGGR